MNLEQSTTLLLVKSLSQTENRVFGDLLSAKYLKLRKDIPLLFKVLVAKGKTENYSKESLYAKLYKGTQYKDQRLRKVLSILKKEVEEFLVWRELESNKTAYRILLGEVLQKRGLDKQFYKNIDRAKKSVVENQNQISKNIYYDYQIEVQKYEYESKLKREKLDYVPGMIRMLNHFHMLEVLKWACHLQSHESISSAKYFIKEVKAALQFAKDQKMVDFPGLRLYYLTYQAGKDGATQADFELLRDTLDLHWKNFSSGEIRDIYLLAINHCIRLLNQGSKQHLKEAFDLYQSALVKRILYENNQLSPFTYKNMLNIALALNEKEWAFKFLHEEKDHLDKTIRENTFSANLATYYYKVGQYREAIELLRGVQFLDVFDNLKYRTLLARIYYQIGEETALEHHLESFASYLYRQKKLGYHKALYQNLIRVMRKILRSNLRDASVRAQIVEEILKNDQLIEKDWLLSTLEKS